MIIFSEHLQAELSRLSLGDEDEILLSLAGIKQV